MPGFAPATLAAVALAFTTKACVMDSGAGGGGAQGGSSGQGGAAATGGSAPSGPRPGVVVLDTTTDTRSCVPLCTDQLDPAADGDGDDWAFEGGSCVIPGTLTGRNQACTTGEPLPEPVSVPGVVVADDAAGTIDCYPLCVIVTDPASDPEGDGWSWEDNRSCVIPGTITASNQGCMTGEPLPPTEPRPGVLVARDADSECVPLCIVSSMPTDAGSDWAYENNASCLLPGSPTASGLRDCTFGVTPDYTPPALSGNKVADGFYTADGRLYDAYGNDFVMRGVNNAHGWFDDYAKFYAWLALDNIASYGTNTIRVVWETTNPPDLLADVLFHIVELEMVPMLELHGVTGVRDPARLLTMAEYYTRPDVLLVLQDFREYLLINIANEWSGGEEYAATYLTVIANLRAAGLEHTLVIDASGFGQNAPSIFQNAAALRAGDPEDNLLFSIHMYDLFDDPAQVDSVLNQAVTDAVPLIVGEFGHQLTGTNVAWEQIMAKATELRIGYLAWSWMGNNADTAHLDMAEDWEGPLTAWGEDVMNDSNGITATAAKASIFQ